MSDRSVAYRDRKGNAARIAYRRSGQGPAVVLIHGVGLQGDIWAPQVEALAADHDVVAVDMLGHGGSSLPPAEPTLAHYADATKQQGELSIGRNFEVSSPDSSRRINFSNHQCRKSKISKRPDWPRQYPAPRCQ
jgi:hypothetical protein